MLSVAVVKYWKTKILVNTGLHAYMRVKLHLIIYITTCVLLTTYLKYELRSNIYSFDNLDYIL